MLPQLSSKAPHGSQAAHLLHLFHGGDRFRRGVAEVGKNHLFHHRRKAVQGGDPPTADGFENADRFDRR